MKSILNVILVAVIVGTAQAETFTNTDGEQINGVVKRVEPDGLVLMTDSGISKVKFKSLPPEIAQQYGYDPKLAENFQKQQFEYQKAASAEAKKQQDAVIEEQKRAESAAQARKDKSLELKIAEAEAVGAAAMEAEKNKALKEKTRSTVVFGERNISDGALVHPARFVGGGPVSGSLSSVGGGGGVFMPGTPVPTDKLIFVKGLHGVAEGEKKDVKMYREGTINIGQRTLEQWILVGEQ